MAEDELQIRVSGDANSPTLIYLPGLHGDWTLVAGFRRAISRRMRIIEITYPRSLEWSVADYANAVEDALRAHGITQGWVLGESWGSQVAWCLLDDRQRPTPTIAGPAGPGFQVQGIILAGGFVKHPIPRGAWLLRQLGKRISTRRYQTQIKRYVRYANWRHGSDLEIRASLAEFAERRTERDREAVQKRLELMDSYDPRPVARRAQIPVHYLAGAIDPLVPWYLVRWWLRRHCPGYRGGETFWRADHNVLATAAEGSAEQVWRWVTTA